MASPQATHAPPHQAAQQPQQRFTSFSSPEADRLPSPACLGDGQHRGDEIFPQAAGPEAAENPSAPQPQGGEEATLEAQGPSAAAGDAAGLTQAALSAVSAMLAQQQVRVCVGGCSCMDSFQLLFATSPPTTAAARGTSPLWRFRCSPVQEDCKLLNPSRAAMHQPLLVLHHCPWHACARPQRHPQHRCDPGLPPWSRAPKSCCLT